VTAPRILVADDGDLGDRISDLVEERLLVPDVSFCYAAGDLDRNVREDGPFDLLVAGPSACSPAGIDTLSQLRRSHPAMTLLLVTGRTPGPGRSVIRAGAIDVLRPTASDEELRCALDDALSVARLLRADAPAAAGRPELGRVITVSSATGGCGKTFFSTNLGHYLNRHTGGRVCIVDLDLQFGEVSTALRLRPRFTIYDVLRRDDTEAADLAEHVEEYLVGHEAGISVLAAPKEPAEADEIQPAQVTKVLHALRSRFDHVIVDTPGQLNEVVLAAFDQSEMLVVMATLDLPSVRNTTMFLSTLDKLRIPADNVRLILNKEDSDVGIDVAQVEKVLPKPFMTVLPYAKEVSRSINLGMPVLVSAPQAPVSVRMARGMVGLLPEDYQPAAAQGQQQVRRGFFARLTAPLVRTA